MYFCPAHSYRRYFEFQMSTNPTGQSAPKFKTALRCSCLLSFVSLRPHPRFIYGAFSSRIDFVIYSKVGFGVGTDPGLAMAQPTVARFAFSISILSVYGYLIFSFTLYFFYYFFFRYTDPYPLPLPSHIGRTSYLIPRPSFSLFFHISATSCFAITISYPLTRLALAPSSPLSFPCLSVNSRFHVSATGQKLYRVNFTGKRREGDKEK